MFKKYKRRNVAEMRPYVKGEDLTDISVARVDDPENDMGMVARNPFNHADQWYVSRKYFEENFLPMEELPQKLSVDHIEGCVVNEEYVHTHKTSICILTLKNGFQVIGKAGVVRDELFDKEVGEKVSREKAVDQIWLLEGYLLQEKINVRPQ